MRWQTLTSLAYGATGLMYFNCERHCYHCYRYEQHTFITYLTCARAVSVISACPNSLVGHSWLILALPTATLCIGLPSDPPGAIVSVNGTLGPLAEPARHINTLLLAYAPYLLHATSTDVWLVPAGGATRPMSPGLLVLGVKSNKLSLLVGSFRLQDGRTAALVHNQDWRAASRTSLTFATSGGGGEGGRGSHGLSGVRRVDPASGAEVAVSSGSVGLAAGGAELYVSAAAAVGAGRE
jgi:hypothetical protein